MKTLVVSIAVLMLTGCVSSLHPFFTDKDIVEDDALLGAWVSESDDGRRTECSFTKSGENRYEFLYIDEALARFEARLIRLGGETFLDLYPEVPDSDNGLYLSHLVRAHTLARVTIERGSLSIAMMDDGWIRELKDQNKLDVAHERLADGDIVLTAPTAELQAFVLKHTDDKEAFGEAEVFHQRQK